VFEQVVSAAERLRAHGVLFGVSLTATRENADELLNDDTVEFFFGRLGAFYGWIFQYMPIGRSFTLELMPSPEQRLRLYERTWQLVRERRLFLVDFWNSGCASDGCMAAGRAGGYLHVNWNGSVTPCVFAPYAAANVKDFFASGRTLTDAWAQPFFASMRRWQREYGFRESDQAHGRCDNWLAPCPIRDHHGAFRQLLERHRPEPADADAAAALTDPEYRRGMEEFGARFDDLSRPVWNERYLDRTNR
jgi:MoaA/NifB/PqqE/SkfB family radical SAM enzyme